MKIFTLTFRNIIAAVIFFLTISIIIFSCRKEAKPSGILNSNTSAKIDLTEYKLLFSTSLINSKKTADDSYSINLIHNKDVDWDNNIFFYAAGQQFGGRIQDEK